jgi:serine/threonine-protein kinase MRCK
MSDDGHDIHVRPPDSPVVTEKSSPQPEHVYDQPWGANKPGSAPQPKIHRFIMKTFTTPYKCNLCTSLMVGLHRQGTTCAGK